MDPNENLTRQRELATALVEREPVEWRSATEAAEELAGLVLALDEWRRSGGFDPYARGRVAGRIAPVRPA